MPKQRVHNEWFRSVSLGGRKSCPCCKAKLEAGESIWSWGQYIRVKWNTITHFCKGCFPKEVLKPLTDHTDGCGCTVDMVVKLGFHEKRPDWLKMPEPEVCVPPPKSPRLLAKAA